MESANVGRFGERRLARPQAGRAPFPVDLLDRRAGAAAPTTARRRPRRRPQRLPLPTRYSRHQGGGRGGDPGLGRARARGSTRSTRASSTARRARSRASNALLRQLCLGRFPVMIGGRPEELLDLPRRPGRGHRPGARAAPRRARLPDGRRRRRPPARWRAGWPRWAARRRRGARSRSRRPGLPLRLAPPFYRLRGRRPPIPVEQLASLERHWAFDDARARAELDWRPRPLADGLPPTLDHLRVGALGSSAPATGAGRAVSSRAPMFTIFKDYSFSAGHAIRGHTRGCQNLHGHNYRVRVHVAAETLDALGMVIDFADLKAIIDGVVGTLRPRRDQRPAALRPSATRPPSCSPSTSSRRSVRACRRGAACAGSRSGRPRPPARSTSRERARRRAPAHRVPRRAAPDQRDLPLDPGRVDASPGARACSCA